MVADWRTVMGYNLAANMNNDAGLWSISSSADPSCCIRHLDRNCSIKTRLYTALLTASFCCGVKNDWFPQPPPHSECVKMDWWAIRDQDFPTIVCAPQTGKAVSVLTLRQTWPSACWHDLPLRPVPARWTAVGAGPRSTASLKTTKQQQYIVTGRSHLFYASVQQTRHNESLGTRTQRRLRSVKSQHAAPDEEAFPLSCKKLPCHRQVKCQTYVNTVLSLKSTVWRILAS